MVHVSMITPMILMIVFQDKPPNLTISTHFEKFIFNQQ